MLLRDCPAALEHGKYSQPLRALKFVVLNQCNLFVYLMIAKVVLLVVEGSYKNNKNSCIYTRKLATSLKVSVVLKF